MSRPPSQFTLRRADFPSSSRSVRPPHQEWKPKSQPNHQQDRRPPRPPPPPPVPPIPHLPNFTVDLCSDNRSFNIARIQFLIKKCNSKSKNFNSILNPSCSVAARLLFQQWTDALEVIVHLWELRLDGVHSLRPLLLPNVFVPSDLEDLNDRLKTLFSKHVKGLIEGDLVQKWMKNLGSVSDEIASVTALLKMPKHIYYCNELLIKRTGLVSERDLIEKRIEEFRSAMKCILDHIDGKLVEDCVDNEGVKVFRFSNESNDYNWGRIHSLMMRECRRLDDGLPIYAFRQEILTQIYNAQITVLIAETGSGKSTQLVQFLADSGLAANESIICTQPRKLAAISLAHRVQEESCGCLDYSIVCHPTYPSGQQFDSKVVYTTDHCLLQCYMKDKNLSNISCIIVDEAHERSLNTDLLLASIKNLLHQRPDLRLIIMSATADANKLADYFFGCRTFHVVGRNFPVDVKYVPCESEGTTASATVASYVSDVVRTVSEIHRTEKEGTILAFLTSQMEVEWACEKFQAPSCVALALHGKLSYEDQRRIFFTYPGKRKVIFTTNLSETSLTIPGVNYVVDSGMVKESRFDPLTGMNVLRVCRISQSSANQRAGRAGRTGPGTCFRLYSEHDYESMPPHLEPEIRRVHLGVAVLRILALGNQHVHGFDFVEAPSAKAIEIAIKSLIQLGAVTLKNDVLELTEEGRSLVKLGIEPRLGKVIIGCFRYCLGREGVVLAAVMANSSSIFCRVGNKEDKLKSDCLKVKFCHHDGDLFSLLSVYKEWEDMPQEKRSKWCWENSINAKSMRRCESTFQELNVILKNEFNYIIPGWLWNPQVPTVHDKHLKNVILSSLAENVAMYSGYDQLGYEVALTGKHVKLHPSCSLLIFGHRPSWVVFSEILSISNEYLVCLTAFDFESLFTLCPPPPFDFSRIESQKLQVRTLTGFGSTLMKKLCGRSNNNLLHLVSFVRTACMDERIGVEVNFDRNEILLFASTLDIEKVYSLVNDALEYERKWLHNECVERSLFYGGPDVSSSVALFGSGAEIKHLELEKRGLTVEVYYSSVNGVDDKELLMFLEKHTSGNICGMHKFTSVGQDSENKEKWGRITFLTPYAAMKATELTQVDFNGSLLKVVPSKSSFGGDHKMFSFPAVKAKVSWPRRCSKGVGIVKCDRQDVAFVVKDFSNALIRGVRVRCKASKKCFESVVISGLDTELSEAEILDVLSTSTNRRIFEFFLVRGDAATDPPRGACEAALFREISLFMPKRNVNSNVVKVQVFPPEPNGSFVRALITFDGSLHLEAAKALEQIEGKVLPGCLSWQKIKCQQLFQSSVSCPAPVYFVIMEQLDSLLASIQNRKGAECCLVRNKNGSYRVNISANATKTVADLRRPLEQLMKGKTVSHPGLSPTILQLLFSRDGIMLTKSLQRETGTHIFFDRHSQIVRVFGSSDKIEEAEHRLVQSLLTLQANKQLDIRLRGRDLPSDLMKEVVKKFGPDLHGLKEKVPGAEFTLNTQRHIISVLGSVDLKQKVEEIVFEIARTSEPLVLRVESEANCPICLCEVEDSYRLEGCGHMFCRLCLVEQCDSAIKSQDGIPMLCTHEGCGVHILLTDLRSLLSTEKLEELFQASLGAFVAASGGTFRFCPSPDCPSIYQVAGPDSPGKPFVCEVCYVETCTRCHLEYHPYQTCEKYREYKDDPDASLKEWCKGKEEHVKHCPVCGFTIEKVDGCNHIACRCGKHICWVCLEFFGCSDDCYNHLSDSRFLNTASSQVTFFVSSSDAGILCVCVCVKRTWSMDSSYPPAGR